MSICIARFRTTHSRTHVSMFGKEMRFQVPPKTFRLDGSRNESGSEFQTVGPATEKPECQMCCDDTANIQ